MASGQSSSVSSLLTVPSDAKDSRAQSSDQAVPKYSLAGHALKMPNNGQLLEVIKSEPEGASQASRVQSDANFDATSPVNQLMDIIRKFAMATRIFSAKCAKKDAPDWNKAKTRLAWADKITQICQQVKSIMAKGGRVVRVAAPSYIFGSIQGSLRELLCFEQHFWPHGPYLSIANLLFLGNYMSGDNSLECILYLLCMQLLAPDQVFLLRGSHETSALHDLSVFRDEVDNKFGTAGSKVFEAICDVFDVMPMAAIINQSIFCSPSGIPCTVSKVDQMEAIPSPLKEPTKCPTALEVLFNEPISNERYCELLTDKEVVRNSPKMAAGFLSNKQGIGSYYSQVALATFLDDNGLSHAIRSHECSSHNEAGFHSGPRCVTLFGSMCSSHCDSITPSEALVALVSGRKIRLLKVENSST